jgi:two-component system, HptB-dependent secretion and biofilm response regulator
MAGLERLLQGVPPGERLRAIEDGVTSQLAGQIEHDDLSTLIVTVPLERRTAPRLASAQQQSEQLEERVSEWRLDLYWGAEQLRSVDVVPAVLGFANQIKILQRHQGQMFLIVSELFNNALDHGLLGLDSRTKNEEGGFERYLEERELRLARLEEGRIEMSFHLHPREDRAVLDIRLRDSGPGFDYVAYMGTVGQEADASLTHGRGVRLVKTLCDTLEYSENGNAVFARYLL